MGFQLPFPQLVVWDFFYLQYGVNSWLTWVGWMGRTNVLQTDQAKTFLARNQRSFCVQKTQRNWYVFGKKKQNKINKHLPSLGFQTPCVKRYSDTQNTQKKHLLMRYDWMSRAWTSWRKKCFNPVNLFFQKSKTRLCFFSQLPTTWVA